jgi:hypothetical protein
MDDGRCVPGRECHDSPYINEIARRPPKRLDWRLDEDTSRFVLKGVDLPIASAAVVGKDRAQMNRLTC